MRKEMLVSSVARSAWLRDDGLSRPAPHRMARVTLSLVAPALLAWALQPVALAAQLPEPDERDSTRLYLAVPAQLNPSSTDSSSDSEKADRLFAEAQTLAEAGSEGPAYRLLFEALAADSQHAPTLTILEQTLRVLEGDEDEPEVVESRRPERTFGWGANEWRRLDTAHFTLIGSASPEQMQNVAAQVERLYLAWDLAFFEVWSPEGRLLRALKGNDSLARTNGRKHTIVLFATRQEYASKLQGVAPNVEVSLGYYAPTRRQSMFFADEELHRPTLLHEVTHQLFQERLGARSAAGDRSNFWLVEGIATVLESLEDHGDHLTIGGYDAERLQYARFNLFSGKVLFPFEDMVGLGQEDFQNDPEVRKLYSQSSGMASWLLIDPSGARPALLARMLKRMYDGADEPELLREGLGVSWDDCVKQYISFLRPLKSYVQTQIPRSDATCLAFCFGDMDDETLATLPQLEKLEWLDLTQTAVTDAGLANLDRFPGLKQLFLTGTGITDRSLAEIAKVTSLEELDLSATRVTSRGIATLAALPNLKVLNLNDTQVDDSVIDALMKFTALEQVDLQGTSVSPQQQARLRLNRDR